MLRRKVATNHPTLPFPEPVLNTAGHPVLPLKARKKTLKLIKHTETDFLHLPNWETVKVNDKIQNYLLVEANPTSEPVQCPRCREANCQLQRYGHNKQYVRDAPIRGRRVQISFSRQRFLGKKCGKVSQQPLPEIDERRRATTRLVDYIRQESLKVDKTFVSVADEVGVNEKTVRDVFTDHVEQLEKSRKLNTPQILGIDEVYIDRKARCVFTDQVNNRIVEILPGNDQETVIRGLLQLPNRHTISIVTMDMWMVYKGAVQRVLPQAKIVLDTFHVRRMANQALKDVLSQMRSTMNYSKRRRTMRDPYLLLRRPYELSEQQKLIRDGWFEMAPEIKAAYELKEEFLNLWLLNDRLEAEKQYDAWVIGVQNKLPDAFREIRTTISIWRECVFNYFDNRDATNAFAESVNGQIKTLQRLGRGFEFPVLRAKIIFGGGFVIRRPPLHLSKGKQNSTDNNNAARKGRVKGGNNASNLKANVARIQAAHEAHDKTKGLIESPSNKTEWIERFEHLLNVTDSDTLP